MKKVFGSGFLKAVLVAWLLSGTLDIVAAFVQGYVMRGILPQTILRYVASGIFGSDAFTGSALMVLSGLVIHFFIAFCWAFLYFVMYPRADFLHKSPLISGIIYGAFVWIVMNRVIVPLTAIPAAPFNLTNALIGMGILMLMIGLPDAFLAQWYYGGKRP